MTNAECSNAPGAMRAALLAGDVSGAVIACFYRVYDALGYGFVESVYRRALAHELRKAGRAVLTESAVEVWYDGMQIGHFRADLIVDQTVIVELKASAALVQADHKQLLDYLRGSDISVGLLLHFGPKPAFHRLVHSRRDGVLVNADERGHDAG